MTRTQRATNTANEIIAQCKNDDMKGVAIDVGLKLMHSVLMPQLYYNCETWSNIPDKMYHALDDVCIKFLRRLPKLPKSTPKVGLLCETGVYRAREKINIAQALYLYKIEHSSNVTLRKVLQHQKDSGLRCYWVYRVNEFLKEIEVDKENVNRTDWTMWRRMIHTAIKVKYAKELTDNVSTKTKHLTSYRQQNYLTALTPNKARQAIRLRHKMYDTAKYCKSKYTDDKCRLCHEQTENDIHVLTCTYNACNVSISVAHSIIDNLHSDDHLQVLSATEHFEKTLNERQKCIEASNCPDRMAHLA